ncbi:hypothetical protein J2X76_005387 [Neorhizobium sp. 2083]|nr:hypothetical protein [Neorhizobium sp. 2083]
MYVMINVHTLIAREETLSYPDIVEIIRRRMSRSNNGSPKKSASLSGVERRAVELDTIASVLPIDRRDELAELLADRDIETLRHLVNQGMGANTLRALTSDLAYLEAWGLGAIDHSLPWPATEALLLKFVAQHLWDQQQRETDPDHGMPANVSRWRPLTRRELL